MHSFSPKSIDFLWDLSVNNNKTWFEENKHRFATEIQTPTKALAQLVYEALDTTHPALGLSCKVTRIYRDARRVRGGEPYKTNLWFFIEKPTLLDSTATAGFWFGIEKEVWNYGLGFYAPKAGTMAKLRQRIDQNPKQLETLIKGIADSEFTLTGEDYKRTKTPAHGRLGAWYNKKQLALMCQASPSEGLFEAGLGERLVAGYLRLVPLYLYLSSLDE